MPSTALRGRRVLVTRAAAQTEPLARLVEAAGGVAVPLPVITTVPDAASIADAQARLAAGGLDWVLFTSATAVRLVCAAGPPPPEVAVAAVGPATAGALRALGREPTVVAADARQEGLVAALAAHPLDGRAVLLPAAEGARPLLAEELRRRGARLEAPPIYRTAAVSLDDPAAREALEPGLRALRERALDAALFLSPSAVRALAGLVEPEALLAALAPPLVVGAIGPTTFAALEELGLPDALVPTHHTAEALVEALADRFAAAPSAAPSVLPPVEKEPP